MKWTEEKVAWALTRPGSVFPYHRWTVVRNVYWGWDLTHEADLIAVSKSRYAAEVEIKVTKSDLKNDHKKWVDNPERALRRPKRLNPKIKKFFYAVPRELADFALTEEAMLQPWSGVIEVWEQNDALRSRIIRHPKKMYAQPCTDREVQKLMRLGCMRYWTRTKGWADGI